MVTLWYRAPEILLGEKRYSTQIDVWSFGCVFGELANEGLPLFVGDSEVGTLFQIFKSLGSPTKSDSAELLSLPYFSPEFPKFRSRPIEEWFPARGMAGEDPRDRKHFYHLMSSVLLYNSPARLNSTDLAAHGYFAG